MSAPTTARPRRDGPDQPRSRPRRSGTGQARSARATVPASARVAESAAVGRAYARRAGRQRTAEAVDTGPGGRSRFVLLVMALLGGGLVASLWLSTGAAADSYRLDEARRSTRDLSERSETLRTEIAALRSAPALAQAARALGLVPTSDVARLVASPDGSVVVVGTPRAAVAPPPVVPPQPPIPAVPPAPGPDGQPAPAPGQPAQQAPTPQAPAPQAPAQPADRAAVYPQQLAAGAGR